MASSFVELLRRRATQQPDRLAYQFLIDGGDEGPRLTYGLLEKRARAVAVRLNGVAAPGDRVLMLFPPGLEFISAFFGCLYARLVCVPVHPPRPHRDMASLTSVAADCRARVVLTTVEVAARVERPCRESACLNHCVWMATDDLPQTDAVRWREPTADPSDLALLQYTSGSTASPKGVMVSHRNLMSNSAGLRRAFELTPDSVTVCWLPSFHDMGLIDGILQPIYTGFPAYLMSPAAFSRHPDRWLCAVSRYGADHCGGPNFLYDHCVDKISEEERTSLDLRRWRSAYNGAEPIRARTLERFTGAFANSGLRPESLFPCYGLAEATLMVCGSPLDQPPSVQSVSSAALAENRWVPIDSGSPDAKRQVSSGRAIHQTEVAIVNPRSSAPAAPDEIGEIWIRGPGVAQGYWNRAAESERLFAARIQGTGDGPFLRSGDMGAVLGSEVFVTGRIKDLIILRGRNFYPQDIEATVQSVHAGLRVDCGAAFGVEIEGREQLVVVQELDRSCRNVSLKELCGDIRQTIVEQHDVDVRDIVLVRQASVPKTTSGKIKRHACRRAYCERRLKQLASG